MSSRLVVDLGAAETRGSTRQGQRARRLRLDLLAAASCCGGEIDERAVAKDSEVLDSDIVCCRLLA